MIGDDCYLVRKESLNGGFFDDLRRSPINTKRPPANVFSSIIASFHIACIKAHVELPPFPEVEPQSERLPPDGAAQPVSQTPIEAENGAFVAIRVLSDDSISTSSSSEDSQSIIRFQLREQAPKEEANPTSVLADSWPFVAMRVLSNDSIFTSSPSEGSQSIVRFQSPQQSHEEEVSQSLMSYSWPVPNMTRLVKPKYAAKRISNNRARTRGYMYKMRKHLTALVGDEQAGYFDGEDFDHRQNVQVRRVSR